MQLPFSIRWAWHLHLFWFGLPGFSFYEVWSDCSVLVSSVWSFLSVLVWSSWYTFSCLIAFALFCFAHLVCIGLVGDALFQAGMLLCSSLLSCSLWSCVCSVVIHFALLYAGLLSPFCLVCSSFYSLVWNKPGCPACCARAGLVRKHDRNIISSCLSQYVGRGQGSAAGAAEDHMTCLSLLGGV